MASVRTPSKGVYFIQEGPNGPIKIGVAGYADTRLAGLQTGNPEELNLLLFVRTEIDPVKIESDLHIHFYKFRIRGEWFYPATALLDFIDELKIQVDTGTFTKNSIDNLIAKQSNTVCPLCQTISGVPQAKLKQLLMDFLCFQIQYLQRTPMTAENHHLKILLERSLYSDFINECATKILPKPEENNPCTHTKSCYNSIDT